MKFPRATRQLNQPQGVHRWGAPEAGTEDGVQALALQGDEGDDLLVEGRARQHGKDREQQQMAHAVAPPLWAARVGHIGECGKQESERHRAISQSWKVTSIQPSRHPATAHAQAATAELNGPGDQPGSVNSRAIVETQSPEATRSGPQRTAM